MSYPNVIYGDYGREKVAQSTLIGNHPLGKLMILPDGRKFRLAQAGSAAALSAGVVVSTTAEVAGHGNVSGSGLLTSATTTENLAGQTDVYLINKSTAITKDQYANGYLHVLGPAASAYIGHVYRIKANDSAAVSTRFKITLEPTDPLKGDLKAGTTLCSLRKSPYKDAIACNAGTIIAGPMGVTPVAVSASFYFWVQRGGPASARQTETVVVDGGPVHLAVSTAGSITTLAATAATAGGYAAVRIGQALGAAAATQAVLIDLTLE